MFCCDGWICCFEMEMGSFSSYSLCDMGGLIEFYGWTCPLTSFEQQLRLAVGEAGYSGGFIDHYIVSIIYPSALTYKMKLAHGIFVILINVAAYTWVIMAQCFFWGETTKTLF